jgi:hypothetical protein
MVERILAVVIAGGAIYLGYRLFFHLPFERNDKGELELPGVKIVLSRVGPGVFFAVFGTLVLYYSMTNPVIVKNDDFIGAGTEVSSSITPQQRAKALTSIEMLNCAERLALQQASSEEFSAKLSVAIREAKRTLMLSVWDPDVWGSPDVLTITGPTEKAPFSVRNIFNSTGGCPE